MKIPHPDNPQHTDNLASISLLEAQGWEGTDASLRVCVFDYGFAWRELDEPDCGDDYLFLYELSHRTPQSFDRTALSSTRYPLEKEFDWVDWEDVALMHGMDLGEWHAQPFPQKIYDLFNVHGYENIFGSSHWDGFKIKYE